MSSVNRVILIGRCGQDPEVRQAGQTTVATVSLATSEKFTRNGEKVEETTWHNLEFWGRLAEVVQQYVTKGSQIYVEGSIKVEKWQDKEGNNRQTTKIRAQNMTMLGGGQQQQNEYQPADEGDSLPWEQ